MSYTKYWKLNERPFEEVCDTHFFYESGDHREALDRLGYVVNDHNMNMGLLTGEVGSGKTLTKNVFMSTLNRSQFEIINFENSNFEFNDILFDIIQRITFHDSRIDLMNTDAPPLRNDKYGLMQVFKKKLDTLFYEEKRHLVIIFDEAQQIANSVLDEIKNLTNVSSNIENFLTIFFVGQPELREKVRRLKQIDQRIFLRFHLNNLDYNNTTNYISHRLRIAGNASNPIFTIPTLELIFRTSGGVPREINRICKLALNYGFAHNLSELSKDDIQLIIDDLQENS